MKHLVILAALALPAAHPLSVARGRAAIVHREPFATITDCRRPYRIVRCDGSEYITEGQWAGWTLHFTAYATLAHGHITVTDSLSG